MSTVLDTRTEGPASELDPFSDEFLIDPFPALDVLRDAGPAVHLTRYGIWAVAGYRDAHAVLRDPNASPPPRGSGWLTCSPTSTAGANQASSSKSTRRCTPPTARSW
ncbi:MAG: hypothetical protein WBF34_23225 [Streptosporangiaceae bacterium]